MTRIDLHSHTTHSDGVLTPAQLVERAAKAGVTRLAVTDHDTISGILEAARAAEGAPLEVVPGLEATVTFHGRECHLLGLGICPLHLPLAQWCRQRASQRSERMGRLLEALDRKGIRITMDEVVAESGGHTLARPHLARVLVKRGYVRTVQDAFDRYLTRRDVDETDTPRPEVSEVIALIHDAGGSASLAHPGANRVSAAELKTLAEMGLDAVEAAHPDHPPSQAGAFVRWARELGLQVTGGSDFHGGPFITAELGAFVTPPEAWERLEEQVRERSRAPQLREAWAEWRASLSP